MIFVKGIKTDDEIILEGVKVNVTTIQGEVFSNVTLSATAKKKLTFIVDGEIGGREFELEVLSSIVSV